MKIRYGIMGVAIVLAVAVIAGGIVLMTPRPDVGLKDDFKDGKLEQVIALAERSNSAYHEDKDFRHEYGPHIEYGEFPASGLRVYLDANPGGDAQWVIIRGTANMQDVFDDLEFIGRDRHELGINVHAGFDECLQDCLP